MKHLFLFFTFLTVINLYGQHDIKNQNLIDLVNEYYDLVIENQVNETLYLYEIPGGKWVKVAKNEEEVYLPSHTLIKIEIADDQIIKTIFNDGVKKQELLSLSFKEKLNALKINSLPNDCTSNPLIREGCSSEPSVLIKCGIEIKRYELPVCPFLMFEDESVKNFEKLEQEAKQILKVCHAF